MARVGGGASVFLFVAFLKPESNKNESKRDLTIIRALL